MQESEQDHCWYCSSLLAFVSRVLYTFHCSH
jgi:hypothetical protein